MVKQIVTVVHGSHLYGTSTPQSDKDFKGVHLPSRKAILLQRAENVIDTSVVVKNAAGKNQAGSVDNQSFAIQRFFEMLSKGDTVATEILFAPDWAIVDQIPLWGIVQAQGKSLLNRQAKGFVGYCQRQAAKYGIKGSRMNAVKTLVDFLHEAVRNEKPGTKLSSVETLLHELSTPFIENGLMGWENIPSPTGADLWHIVCCDRKVPVTTKIVDAYNIYNRVWENYGERARQAASNEGIDWKAVSHAVRVARQALELLRDHKITFPRPDAEELLAIKLGKLPYTQVSPMLEALVQEVNECESTLPEVTNKQEMDWMIYGYYSRA
jgi:RNA repair pathway DNA polymerase beta family